MPTLTGDSWQNHNRDMFYHKRVHTTNGTSLPPMGSENSELTKRVNPRIGQREVVKTDFSAKTGFYQTGCFTKRDVLPQSGCFTTNGLVYHHCVQYFPTGARKPLTVQ